MTDSKLRQFERVWKETGAVEDEARYLLERVRAGDITDWNSYSRLATLNVQVAAHYLRGRMEQGDLKREKLELAAYCSHEPARLVLGENAPEVPERAQDWLRALYRRGVDVYFRANLALAWGHYLPNDPAPYEEKRTRDLLSAVGAWVRIPNAASRGRWQAALQRFFEAYPIQGEEAPGFSYPPKWSPNLLQFLSAFAGIPGGVADGRPRLDDVTDIVCSEGESDRVLETVRSALTPWALGYPDPAVSADLGSPRSQGTRS